MGRASSPPFPDGRVFSGSLGWYKVGDPIGHRLAGSGAEEFPGERDTMGWQGIDGHDDVVARFVAAEARGRIAGTYLFIGPEGIGKGAFTKALAKSLVCLAPRPGLIACGACASCVQAAAGSHPDIDIVSKPDDRSTIPLEVFIGDREHRMREGLCWRILLRPALGGRKVAVILDADHLAEEGANCLLKTLEEPPDGAVIILVGTALERQLPTIRSRSQIIRFSPLDTEIVRRVLAAEAIDGSGPSAAAIAAAAGRSGGSIDRARLLLDPEIETIRARLLEQLAARPFNGVELSKEVQASVEAAGKDAPPRRARLRILLGTAVDFFRAAMRRDAAGPTDPAAAPSPPDAALVRAVNAWGGTAEDAIDGLRRTLDALDGIDRNAHLPTLVDAWSARLEPLPPPPRSVPR
jgi:DNA polymerase-3 subunit delta'